MPSQIIDSLGSILAQRPFLNLDGFAGLRVVGDVHGEADAFETLVDDALDNDFFLLQLGDLIDYGPDSPRCMALMRELMLRGQGIFLRGNHDDKLYRYMLGRQVKIVKQSLGRTLEQLENCPQRSILAQWFMQSVEYAPYWLRFRNMVFVHAAFMPDMLNLADPEDANRHASRGHLRSMALYGETEGQYDGDGKPIRTLSWVERIPDGITVIVGHDMKSQTAPVTFRGELGGTAIFLDTGSGKGGILSHLDFRF